VLHGGLQQHTGSQAARGAAVQRRPYGTTFHGIAALGSVEVSLRQLDARLAQGAARTIAGEVDNAAQQLSCRHKQFGLVAVAHSRGHGIARLAWQVTSQVH